jgi:hypothetical protein
MSRVPRTREPAQLVRLSVVIFAVIAVCGCDDGVQYGRFSVGGTSSHSLADVAGALTIVRGQPQPRTRQNTGEQPLLYILALAPSITASGAGSSHDDGAYVSKYRQSWDTAQGKVTIELSWDRRTDSVSISNATFDRQRGNVFVLVRNVTGDIAVTQAGPLDAGLEEYNALSQIQAELPADSPAKHVTLVR